MFGWAPFVALVILRYHFHDSIPIWAWGLAVACLLFDENSFKLKIPRVEGLKTL
jgi:hypothetical protein